MKVTRQQLLAEARRVFSPSWGCTIAEAKTRDGKWACTLQVRLDTTLVVVHSNRMGARRRLYERLTHLRWQPGVLSPQSPPPAGSEPLFPAAVSPLCSDAPTSSSEA